MDPRGLPVNLPHTMRQTAIRPWRKEGERSMRIHRRGREVLPLPEAALWDTLSRPEALPLVFPLCQDVQPLSPGRYRVSLRIPAVSPPLEMTVQVSPDAAARRLRVVAHSHEDPSRLRIAVDVGVGPGPAPTCATLSYELTASVPAHLVRPGAVSVRGHLQDLARRLAGSTPSCAEGFSGSENVP